MPYPFGDLTLDPSLENYPIPSQDPGNSNQAADDQLKTFLFAEPLSYIASTGDDRVWGFGFMASGTAKTMGPSKVV